jgi:hypothetical protein
MVFDRKPATRPECQFPSIPLPAAKKIQSTLQSTGVQARKITLRRDGTYIAEFRKADNGPALQPAEQLAGAIQSALGDVNVVSRHEWFREWLPEQPRSVVIVEFRLAATV